MIEKWTKICSFRIWWRRRRGKKFNILFSFTFHTAGLWTQPLEVYVKDFSDLLLSLWVIETGLMTRYEQTVLQATGDIIFGTVQTSNVVTELSYSFWGHTRKTTQAVSERLIKSNPFTWVLFLPPFLKKPPTCKSCASVSGERGNSAAHKLREEDNKHQSARQTAVRAR